MRKMEKEKVCEKAQKELLAIMEGKELSSNGVDNASKLVDMIKDIKNMEYWDVKCEYYEAILDEMQGGYSNNGSGGYSNDRNGNYSRDGRGNGNGGNYSNDGGYANDYDNGNSYRRGRNQRTGEYMHRPNYSRLSGDDTDMEEYRRRKSEYSNSRDEGSKERMLDALEEFMGGVCSMLKQIYKDSDTGDEREIIQRYARQIANM